MRPARQRRAASLALALVVLAELPRASGARWHRAASLALGLVLLAGCAADDGTRAPRRLLLVTIDTLRADRLGAYGDANAATPHLDALAAQGARFDAAMAPTPLTLPSHATLLTGMDPPEHGVHHNGIFRLAKDVPVLSERLREADFATAAFVSAWILNARFGLDRGFDVYDDRMAVTQQATLAVAERRADATVDAALAWLDEAPDRFFLWVHLYDPHALHRPPEPFAARFRHDPYAGEVAFVDQEVGRLLDGVAERFGDGALVALTADHGESLGEHGEATHSYTVYEATQRVPLILAGPGIPEGLVVPDVVQLSDLAPTLLELLDLPPLPDASGRSLAPALAGQPLAPRPAYSQTLASWYDMGWSPVYTLRTPTHRYVRLPRPELYERAGDPAELEDVASAQPEMLAELSAALDARLANAAPASPNAEIDTADRARLAALGYLPEGDVGATLALGISEGPSPRDEIALVAVMHEANSLLESDPAAALALVEDLGDEHWMLSMKAVAALAAGRAELARQAALALVARDPADATGVTTLGRTWEMEGDPAKARGVYEAGLAVNPESGAILVGLGRIAEAERRRDAALELYERSTSVRLPSAEGVWRLAALRLEAGEIDEARGLLAGLDPSLLSREAPALRLGQAELHAGRIDMGLLRVKAGLRGEPDSAALLRAQGALLEARGDVAASLGPRTRALELEPDSPIAQNDLAWALALLRRRPQRALELATRAADALPDVPAVLGTLAAAQLAAGQTAAALASSERALEGADDRDRSLLLLQRAEALARLGRTEEARRAYATALGGRNETELSGGEAAVARLASAELERAGL